MTFIETFTAVFTAMILSKIAEEAYKRYMEGHVKRGFDTVEGGIKKKKDSVSSLLDGRNEP